MDNLKLIDIIANKNKTKEREAMYTAENIIEQIVTTQKQIQKLNENLVILRNELAKLEVEQLDSNSILGVE